MSHFSRFFPPPNYLSLNAVGFDVSDQSIKFVELKRTTKGLRLGDYGTISIPLGIIASGKILDQEKLVTILKTMKKDKHLKYVRVSLPEEQIYSFRVRVPGKTRKDIRDALELSLEEHIPISAAEATFDFGIIGATEEGFDLHVSAVPTVLIESYIDVFRSAELYPLSFELEGAALARALIREGDQNSYIIVDFGETRTGMAIIVDGALLFTSTVEIGGYSLTKMIEKTFNISTKDADMLKRTYGMQKTPDGKDLFSTLISGVSVLRDEVNKHLIYWQTHKDEGGKEHQPIKKVLLCGGNANVHGVAEYLAQSLRLSVELSNPWQNISGYKTDVPVMTARQAQEYATAIGLALAHHTLD